MWDILLLLSAVIPKVFVFVEGTTAFNCRNSLISDEWREYVLNEVNDYRRSLAEGKVYDRNKVYLPRAKNMNRLNWDCNLEEMAYEGLQKIMSSCQIPDTSITSPYQSIAARFEKKNCNITSQTKLTLYAWWQLIKYVGVNYPPNANGSPSVPGAPSFIRMATGNTTAFACTYDLCDSMPNGIMACIFNDMRPNPVNYILYEKASTDQEICSACSNCTEHLCPQPPASITIPSTCKVDNLSNDTGNTAIWMHNYYRKLLASGWAKDPKAKSGYAPPGKQMKKLEYECSNSGGTNIAEATYKAIEQCPATDPTSTAGYSMNFLRIKDYKLSQQDALKQAIEKWWGELGQKGLGDDTTFHDNSGIKSFANMAYDHADKFACAVQNCQQSGQTLVACQYNAVITEGDKIYETGKVCSGCKKLSPARKCSDPAGLCE